MALINIGTINKEIGEYEKSKQAYKEVFLILS